MKIEELLKIYDKAEEILFLLDVRTPFEYAEKHILGTINIPIDEIEENLDRIPQDLRVVTICQHGVRSAIVCEFLVKNGYRAESMEGGMVLWTGQTETI